MKRIIIITLMVVGALLFTMKYAPAQVSEPIVGNWEFTLAHKIDYNAMVDTLVAHGVHKDSINEHAVYYMSLAAVIISRCESSTIFFSPFENQVRLETKRYNDPSIADVQWGTWIRLTEGRYMVEFKNRLEFYRLNPITGNFVYEKAPHNISFVSSMLDNNMMLIKKGD